MSWSLHPLSEATPPEAAQPPAPRSFWPAQPRNDVLPVERDKRLLVASDVVDVDLAEAEVDEMLQVVDVLVRVSSDQHAVLVVVGADELGHSFEIFGLTDVALGKCHSSVRPIADRRLGCLPQSRCVGDLDLQDLRHCRGIFAGLTGAGFVALD